MISEDFLEITNNERWNKIEDLYNCLVKHEKENPSIDFSIEMADTISDNMRPIPIILKLENLTPDTITVRDPKLWGNAWPHVKHRQDIVPSVTLVRYNPDAKKRLIDIGPYETVKIRYDFTLDQLYIVKSFKPGSYDLFYARIEINYKKQCLHFIRNEIKNN